ncbi:MAG: TlpA family protein disulfide reductase [Proteobacteria bacterium]|jgi:thiol-disulfide isomerase/thioredoxin|nr:TlpA family protein disulfide reductase [Pseudomonadota bacterium]
MGVLFLWMVMAFAAPEMIPTEDVDLVGRTAPPIQAQMMEGGDFSLESLRGSPVVLAFWASWCGPCRNELPALSELAKKRPEVKFFAVNVDREIPPAQRFLDQVKSELPVVWDQQSIALGSFQVLSMPTLFLIDKRGTVKFLKVGYGTASGLTDLEKALDELK